MSRIVENSGELSLPELADLYIDSLREDLESQRNQRDSVAERAAIVEDQPPRVGDLWLTKGTSENPPMLIAISWIGDDFCRAVVVLEEPELAAEDDLLVSAEQCSLGVPVALCTWRDLPVSNGDLGQFVGSLPDEIVEPLAMMLQHRLTRGFRRRALGSGRLSTGERGVRWVIESTADATHQVEYYSGAPILNALDPRIHVRQELERFTAYLENKVVQGLVVEQSDSRQEERNISGWLEGLVRPNVFPASFGLSPRLAFWSTGQHARAFAQSGNEELVASVRPGQQVVLNLAPDGRGEVINEIREFETVGLVLASRQNGKIVPIGFRGQPAQPALVVSRSRRELIWYDRTSAAGELFLAVFVAE